ncbi:MAG: TetR/AcrR family transcriptional regulator [Negativicutes bacterium]
MSKKNEEGNFMVEIMGRRERKKLQSKNTILAAAVSQFMAKGVRETSIADIMGTAELGIGTFYNYFESKEALLLCLLEQIVDEAKETSKDLMEKKRPAAETLSAVMLKTAEQLDANRFVLPLFLSVSDRTATPMKKMMPRPKMAPAFKAVFVELVKYGQARGEFRSEISAELVTEMFHSIFQAASFSTLPYSFIDNVRLKIELLMDGLKPRHHVK